MSSTLVPGVPTGSAEPPPPMPTDWAGRAMQTRVRRRYRTERRFRLAGIAAVIVSVGFLAFLLSTMLGQGMRGFVETRVRLTIDLRQVPSSVPPLRSSRQALGDRALEAFVNAAARRELGDASVLSDDAWLRVRHAVMRDPALVGRTATFVLPTASAIDVAAKGDGTPAAEATVARLSAHGLLSRGFDGSFLTSADSTDPVRAGIWGALKGSLMVMAMVLLLALPVGVCAAMYLEEFAARSRWARLIEVSINNLAAVPSIIFGLLGLSVLLGTFGLPRSTPLVGGITLALMTMPIIVIAARSAIRSVPPSIREAALGIGASPAQVVFHHVLPFALPGILTGTIIGMARALGETAPLLLIGMRAFIAAPPSDPGDPATVLPVQIFLWSDQVERGFVEKTSAAILLLLAVLLAMNALAIYLRDRLERRL